VASEDEDEVPRDGERDQGFQARQRKVLGVGDVLRGTDCPGARVSLMVEMIGAVGEGVPELEGEVRPSEPARRPGLAETRNTAWGEGGCKRAWGRRDALVSGSRVVELMAELHFLMNL
jgi:hypothetical protein